MRVEERMHAPYPERVFHHFRLDPEMIGFPVEGMLSLGDANLTHPTTFAFHTLNGQFTPEYPDRLAPFIDLNPHGDIVGLNLPRFHKLPSRIILPMLVPDGSDKMPFISSAISELTTGEGGLILAGASAGGRWATSLAAQCPGRVEKLVVADPPGVISSFSLALLNNVRKSANYSNRDCVRLRNIVQAANWTKDMFINYDFLGRFYGVQYAKDTLFYDFKKVLDENPQAHIWYFTGKDSLINNFETSNVLVNGLLSSGVRENKDYEDRFRWKPIKGYDHMKMCEPRELTELFKLVEV